MTKKEKIDILEMSLQKIQTLEGDELLAYKEQTDETMVSMPTHKRKKFESLKGLDGDAKKKGSEQIQILIDSLVMSIRPRFFSGKLLQYFNCGDGYVNLVHTKPYSTGHQYAVLDFCEYNHKEFISLEEAEEYFNDVTSKLRKR
jgi:hypothetical protein